ncbi:MAG: hypothetical protein P1V20_00455 [Verrucomicrobiales bacterium]|nr:hypothetical protein [Verrucomicrobiales bacterium]
MKSLSLLLVPMLFLVGCFGGGGDGELAVAEKELEELRAEVKALEDERNELRKERSDKKAKIPKSSEKSEKESSSDSMKEAEEYVALLEDHLAKTEQHIEQWREPMWKSFEGLPFKGLTLADGEVIPLVIISKVTGESLGVLVDGAPREIKWADLAQKSRLTLMHEDTVLAEITNN